jgi:hypothetical protein
MAIKNDFDDNSLTVAAQKGRNAAYDDLETGDFSECPYTEGSKHAEHWHTAYNFVIEKS